MKRLVRCMWSAVAPCYRFGVVVKRATLMSLVGMMGIGTVAYSGTVTANDGFDPNANNDVRLFYLFLSPTPPAFVANLSGTPTSGTKPISVQFTDSSTGSITTWFWQFGDNKGARSCIF